MTVESPDQGVLDFEKGIVEIEEKIEHLKVLAKEEDMDISKEIHRLQTKLARSLNQAYQNLTPWQKAQIARHPNRPHCLDYIHALIEDFVILSGDRLFADDEAMITGIGSFEGVPVAVIGQTRPAPTPVLTRKSAVRPRPLPPALKNALKSRAR